MNLRPLASLGAALSISVLACSSSSGGSPVSDDQASVDVSKAFCQKYSSCAAALVQSQYGDEASCEARFKLSILPSLAATGTGATAAQYESCAGDLASATCEDILDRNLPKTCQTVAGTLADGSACGVDAQCKNKLCRIPDGQTCGVCSSVAAAGGACTADGQCDVGLKCSGGSCVAFGAAGASCDGTHPCKVTLYCNDSGTCATPGKAGATCTKVGVVGCDLLAGLWCSTSKVCTQLDSAAAGKQCGLIDSNFAFCTGGSTCRTATGQPSGTCEAPAADGATCDAINGPSCLAPATCANGLCKIDDPAACK